MEDNLLNKISSRKDFEYFFRFTKLADNFDCLWRKKSLARESLKEWLISNKVNQVIAENTANACSELIENSIKYGIEKETSLVYIGIESNLISIETLNKCDENQKQLLEEYIDEITNSNDLNKMYLEKVKQAILSNESQLGLVKLTMETKGNIQFIEHEQKNIVHIKIDINV